MSVTETPQPASTPRATASSEAQLGAPLPPTEASPPRRRWGPMTVMLVVVVLGLGFYFFIKQLTVVGETLDIQNFQVTTRTFPVILEEKGELQAANSIDIRCELEGRSTIIYLIEEGKRVEQGDLLVELASDEIDENIRDAEIKVATASASYEASVQDYEILIDQNASDIRKAELAVHTAELELEKYQQGEREELLQDAKLALEKAESVLDRATQDYEDSKELFEEDFVTRIELENDRFTKYEAEIELKKAKLGLEVLEKYTIPLDLQTKQSDLDEAKKDLDRTKKSSAASEATAKADVEAKKAELKLVQDKLEKLNFQKSKARIYAPSAGLVVYTTDGHWSRSESSIQEGTQVREQQSIIRLPDTSSMKVELRIHEAKTEDLKIGLPAKIEIEGVSGRVFQGKVSKIAALADTQNRWLNPNLKEYQTEVLLEGEVGDLKPGNTARVAITVAQLENVVAVPVQAVRGQGERHYVFVKEGDRVVPREVKVGLSSTKYVEIVQGLSAGEVVRLAVTENEERQLSDKQNDNKKGDHKPSRPAKSAAGS